MHFLLVWVCYRCIYYSGERWMHFWPNSPDHTASHISIQSRWMFFQQTLWLWYVPTCLVEWLQFLEMRRSKMWVSIFKIRIFFQITHQSWCARLACIPAIRTLRRTSTRRYVVGINRLSAAVQNGWKPCLSGCAVY